MTVTILAIDDEGARREDYLEIAKASKGRLHIEHWWSPEQAADAFDPKVTYGGAIVDFHLQARVRRNPPTLKDGTAVTTGLGMMAWLQERSPSLPLYSITELSREHAPLFYSAAYIWCGATPLFEVEVGNPERYLQSAEDFLEPGGWYRSRNFKRVKSAAEEHFTTLMNLHEGQHLPGDTLLWLSAFERAGKNTALMRDEVNKRLLPDIQIVEVDSGVLARKMAYWQLHLGRMLHALGIDTSEWQPDLPFDEEDRLSPRFTQLSNWGPSNGPVYDYISRLTNQEFFHSPDVRATMLAAQS